MATSFFSSREFNQDTAGAKRAAGEGPVFITDRGEPAFVLMSIADYRRLTGATRPSIADLLWMPGADEVELEIPPREKGDMRPVDLED